MSTEISLTSVSGGKHMLGQRESATPVRERIEFAISHGDEVILNFDGISATQSFVDELVGALILRAGPSVLDHLAFRNCTADVKAIVKFVAADRADQYAKCSGSDRVRNEPSCSALSDFKRGKAATRTYS